MSDLPATTKKNRGAPFGYCLVATTGTSSICQKRGLSVRGRLIRTVVDANLGYLEHLARGRDDLLEAMDCVSCSPAKNRSVSKGLGGVVCEVVQGDRELFVRLFFYFLFFICSRKSIWPTISRSAIMPTPSCTVGNKSGRLCLHRPVREPRTSYQCIHPLFQLFVLILQVPLLPEDLEM